MRLRLTAICLTVSAFTFIWAKPLSGRPVIPSLEMLTKSSPLIVVAQVEEIEREPDILVATARITDVWKGAPLERLRFRASRSWVCDSSRAVVGETIVLFLQGDPHSVMSISYSGAGRLPVSNDGKQMVGLYAQLRPVELKRLMKQVPENAGGLVELEILKTYVQRLANSHAETAVGLHRNNK